MFSYQLENILKNKLKHLHNLSIYKLIKTEMSLNNYM